MNDLRKESDRGAVLVSIAILDDVITRRLRTGLRHGSNRARDRLLLPPLGGLSSFMNKMDYAYCAGLIAQTVYHDIRLLNRLRNKCAHEWRHFRIDSDVIRTYLDPMIIMRALKAADEVDRGLLFPPGIAPRRVFDGTVAALVTLSNMDPPIVKPGSRETASESGNESRGRSGSGT